jgi:hypothetical protein
MAQSNARRNGQTIRGTCDLISPRIAIGNGLGGNQKKPR